MTENVYCIELLEDSNGPLRISDIKLNSFPNISKSKES